MYVKVENKFDEKYDMWVDTKDLETLTDPAIFNNISLVGPIGYKKDMEAYCHVASDTFGIKFKLIGCFIHDSHDGLLSIDDYKRMW